MAPKEEVTVDYSFFTHESFAGRPLGLLVNLHYEDVVSQSDFSERPAKNSASFLEKKKERKTCSLNMTLFSVGEFAGRGSRIRMQGKE